MNELLFFLSVVFFTYVIARYVTVTKQNALDAHEKMAYRVERLMSNPDRSETFKKIVGVSFVSAIERNFLPLTVLSFLLPRRYRAEAREVMANLSKSERKELVDLYLKYWIKVNVFIGFHWYVLLLFLFLPIYVVLVLLVNLNIPKAKLKTRLEESFFRKAF